MMADFPAAADGSERQGFNFRAHEPDVDDLRGRIESIIPHFCANPSCIQAFCPLHCKGFIKLALACWLTMIFSNDLASDHPSPPAAAPRLTSQDYPEGESCGSLCFRENDFTFRVIQCVVSAPDLAYLAIRKRMSSGVTPR